MSTDAATIDPERNLEYESRVRPRYAAVAVAAGLLLVVAAAVQLGGPHTKVDELTTDLLVANQRFPLDLIASIINGIGSLAVAATLAFLWRCSNARSADVRGYVRSIAVAGGVISAVTGVVYAVIVAVKVHQFVTTGAQTYEEANRLTSASGLLVLQLIGQAGALLLAVGFVLVALSAMRQGLLTRFMGYLGIFAGVLVLFQITQIPIVQGYWLAALGYLFSGRWPTGIPPAWRSGKAEPWPPSSELRARRVAGAAAGGGRRGATPAPEPQTVSGPSADAARTRASTPKRKRKRRG